jgi:hypothetical protein
VRSIISLAPRAACGYRPRPRKCSAAPLEALGVHDGDGEHRHRHGLVQQGQSEQRLMD